LSEEKKKGLQIATNKSVERVNYFDLKKKTHLSE